MVMRIWNTSKFKAGRAGRSSCPKWRNQDMPFQPNEVKEVTDQCGRWLISEYSCYGLVALPDRNIVTDPKEYETAKNKLFYQGIQNIYKWAERVISQYREEAKLCMANRDPVRRPNYFVLLAQQIKDAYMPHVQANDPKTIHEQEVMKKILNMVDDRSYEKELDTTLKAELEDQLNNRKQYTSRDDVPSMTKDLKVPTPAEPTKPAIRSTKPAIKKGNKKRPNQPAKKPAQIETLTSELPPIDLDDAAMALGRTDDGGDPPTT